MISSQQFSVGKKKLKKDKKLNLSDNMNHYEMLANTQLYLSNEITTNDEASGPQQFLN